MSKHKKTYTDAIEFLKASAAMGKYQRIHNLIRNDYITLLEITDKNKSDQSEFNALYRASLKSLFSLIEADLFGLNNLDPYENYSDKNSFEIKFKKTFKQICSTWNKNEILTKYLDSKFANLKELRKKRDELIHPKDLSHIHVASDQQFEKIKTVFSDYDNFINTLMNDFFIEIDPKLLDDLTN